MNCLEFRRNKQAELHFSDDAAQQHLAECAACREFDLRLRDADNTVADMLNSVSIPDGLADRILLRTQWAGVSSWKHWALAASVVLGLATALTLPLLRDDTDLARAALAHVEEEPDTLIARQQVAAPAIATALATVGAKLRGDIGQVTYLGNCPLPGGEGKHLVISSPYGRYSLILMPAQINSRKRAEEGLHAAVAKPATRGSYAIVGSATPDLLKIEKLLDQNVIW